MAQIRKALTAIVTNLRKRLWLALILFIIFVLALTARDYLIHFTLYYYNLSFDYNWANYDWAIYSIQIQLAVITTSLIARRIEFLILTESFVLSGGHDLILFAVWNRCVFPTGNWWWLGISHVFGVWTTAMQFAFTILGVSIGLLICVVLLKKRREQQTQT